MTYDQAQSPRLGQRLAPENPGIRIVTWDDLPSVAYRGQIVYLQDRDYILIYDGAAWQPVGDTADSRLFVSATDPALVAANNVQPGDQWLNLTDDILYIRNDANDDWYMPVVPPDSVGTGQLQADAITAKHTLTGPLIRTAASGSRMQMRSDVAGGVLEFYNGLFGETPGEINPDLLIGDRPAISMTSGTTAANPASVTFSLFSMNASAMVGQARVDGALEVTAGINQTGATNQNNFAGPVNFNSGMVAPNSGALVPIGGVIMFPGALLPPNYLICDGSTFSSSTYPTLFGILGTNVLPDLRDRVPVGAGTEVSNNSTEGRSLGNRNPVTHNHNMKNHRHGIPSGGSHDHGGSTGNTSLDPVSTTAGGGTLTRLRADPHDHSITTGGEHAHGGETDPPDDNVTTDTTTGYYGLRFLIRAK